MEPSVEQALVQAVEAHREGKLQVAERLYRAALEAQPRNPGASHNLGALLLGTGETDAALPFLKAAMELNPREGRYWFGYIEALIRAGQPDVARRVLKQGRQLGLKGPDCDRLDALAGASPAEGQAAPATLTPAQQEYQGSILGMRQGSRMDYPAHVHLETFAMCNAACNFCPYPGLERKGARMSDELIEKIVRDLEDMPRSHEFQLSPFKVNEPFLDNRLFDLLAMFQERLPNAGITLTTNASPLTEKTLLRLAGFPKIGYLWISFNDHREAEYEAAMQLPYRRTIERLNLVHRLKAEGKLPTPVVLSRVGDRSPDDAAFEQWVGSTYPLFEVVVFPRGEWLGQVASSGGSAPPDIGCSRWFEISITATGVVAHCCMDGKAEFPIGDVRKSHLLEIYNHPEYRRLRASTVSRLDVEPCRRCNFL